MLFVTSIIEVYAIIGIGKRIRAARFRRTNVGVNRYDRRACCHFQGYAAALYRDHSRGRDDTTIAVVRNIANGRPR